MEESSCCILNGLDEVSVVDGQLVVFSKNRSDAIILQVLEGYLLGISLNKVILSLELVQDNCILDVVYSLCLWQ